MTDLFDRNVFIGIIGTRRRDTREDYVLVTQAFLEVSKDYVGRSIIIVSGGCPEGGDRFAEIIAKTHGHDKLIHYPDKTRYLDTPLRFRATKQNYERNTLIARDSKDELIACVASDRKGGTEDTIKKWIRFHHKDVILV